MTAGTRRWRALGGVVGPAVFIATWAALGVRRLGYSPIEEPISRLAAIGASSRPAMTAGFVAFAGGVGLYAAEMARSGVDGDRRGNGRGAVATAAAVCATATLGVAALPLDRHDGGDAAHAVAAGLSYAALASTPLLAARASRREGRRARAVLSVAAGAVCGAALATSAFVPSRTGLWQRTGLTVGDAWIMVSAARLAFRGAGATGPPTR